MINLPRNSISEMKLCLGQMLWCDSRCGQQGRHGDIRKENEWRQGHVYNENE